MGKEFDRVAIVVEGSSVEYIILEPELIIDFGEGQGPKGGVITLKDGWIAALGSGEARLAAGYGSPGGDIPPTLVLRDAQSKRAVQVAAYDDPSEQSQARVYLRGVPASLHMRDAAKNENVLLEDEGNLWLGGKSADGDIMLFANGEQDNRTVAKATINLNGGNGRIRSRSLIVQDESGRTGVSLDGQQADIRLGGGGKHGGFYLYRATGDRSKDVEACVRISHDAVFKIGGNQTSGQIYLFDSDDDTRIEGQAKIHLNGITGDITLAGADCAERFTVADEASRDPGTVLVVGEGESLVSCSHSYDRRVAGVVSGAGRCRPGIILDGNAHRGAVPVALVGKTYCKVDANYEPIECGDLLTTSQTPGHAMRASDRERAFGSILGKALAPFSGGTGLVPILVALQ
jgi:hypothetical protein